MTGTRIPPAQKNGTATVPPPAPPAEPWTIASARSLYNIEGWGIGFFDINDAGHVVEEIVEFGKVAGVGLECGSKPELQAVLGLAEHTDHLIVCNGYKDEEFMRLALMGQKLGHQVFIVLEQLSEVDVLLQVADELGVRPTAGVRIKLYSEGSGRWVKSGGG